MATKYIKKVATGASDLSGLKSSRYEKLQVSYGVIAAGTYTLGDTLVFSDVPSQDIIKATVVSHGSDPSVLDVYPGSDNSGTFTLNLPASVTSAVKLSYIIEYIRGTGRVGSSGYTANAYGSGQALESGEGELFKVTVLSGAVNNITAAVAEEQVAADSV